MRVGTGTTAVSDFIGTGTIGISKHFIGILSKFNPFIKYDWTTEPVVADGLRYLTDIKAPATNAPLASGQGLDSGTTSYVTSKAVTADAKGTLIAQWDSPAVIGDGVIIGSNLGGRAYIGINTGKFGFGLGDTSYVVALSAVSAVINTHYEIRLEWEANVGYLYIDDVLIYSHAFGGATSTGVFSVGGLASSFYLAGAIRNTMYIANTRLSATESAHLFNNPETFLYKDAGILKSEILPQATIDNVVTYLPLCENGSNAIDLTDDAVYAIPSYVATMRTNAQSLTKGLQTHRWLRDANGVPTDILNGFVSDGTNKATVGDVLTVPYAIRTVSKVGGLWYQYILMEDELNVVTLYKDLVSSVGTSKLATSLLINEVTVSAETATEHILYEIYQQTFTPAQVATLYNQAFELAFADNTFILDINGNYILDLNNDYIIT